MSTIVSTDHQIDIPLTKAEETALIKTGTGFGDVGYLDQDVENVENLIEFTSKPPKFFHTALKILREVKNDVDALEDGFIELNWITL